MKLSQLGTGQGEGYLEEEPNLYPIFFLGITLLEENLWKRKEIKKILVFANFRFETHSSYLGTSGKQALLLWLFI